MRVVKALAALLVLAMLSGCAVTALVDEQDVVEDPDGGACAEIRCEQGVDAFVVEELDGLCVRRWCIDGLVQTKPKAAGWPCVHRADGDPNFTTGQCNEIGVCY